MNRERLLASRVPRLHYVMLIMLLAGCGGSGGGGDGSPPTQYNWQVPPGFPTPREDPDNPLSEEKVALGRLLFYDRRMSINQKMGCADCRLPALAFTDGRTTSEGTLGDMHPRNAMSMTNVVYNASQNWANPNTLTLSQQALVPMFGEVPVELGWTDHEDEILARFAADPDYASRFATVYPDEENPVSVGNVVKALVAFEMTMISGNAPVDKATYQDQPEALSDSARRGMDLFFSERLECFHCHGGFNFSSAVDHDGLVFEQVEFHNNGLYNINGTGDYPHGNQGVHDVTHKLEDRGMFKAPTLRNIALTAPYMHDGSIETLDAVIDHYARGGRLIEEGPYAGDGAKHPLKSSLLASFQITEQEKRDLLAFFDALTDWEFICDPRFSDPFGNLPPHSDC